MKIELEGVVRDRGQTRRASFEGRDVANRAALRGAQKFIDQAKEAHYKKRGG